MPAVNYTFHFVKVFHAGTVRILTIFVRINIMAVPTEFKENEQSVTGGRYRAVRVLLRDASAFSLALEGGWAALDAVNTAVLHEHSPAVQGASFATTGNGAGLILGIAASVVVGWQVGDKLVFRPVRSFLGRNLGVPVEPK